MLNCAPTEEDPICVPDSGKFPAKLDKNFGNLSAQHCRWDQRLPHPVCQTILAVSQLNLTSGTE